MEKNVELKNKIDPVVYNEFRDMVGWGGAFAGTGGSRFVKQHLFFSGI